MMTEKISTHAPAWAVRWAAKIGRRFSADLSGKTLPGSAGALIMLVVTAFLGLAAMISLVAFSTLIGLLVWLAAVCFLSLCLLSSLGTWIGRLGRYGLVALVALIKAFRP